MYYGATVLLWVTWTDEQKLRRGSKWPLHINCRVQQSINSLIPGDAYTRQWSPLVHVMACRLFGANLLHKPMLTHCQLNSREQISVKVKDIYIYNVGHFVHTSMCYRLKMATHSILSEYLLLQDNKLCSKMLQPCMFLLHKKSGSCLRWYEKQPTDVYIPNTRIRWAPWLMPSRYFKFNTLIAVVFCEISMAILN